MRFYFFAGLIWLAIIGRWQNYPPEKRDRIEAKLDKLNGLEEA